MANGWLVIALSVLGGFNLLGRGEPSTGEVERNAFGERFGNRLFLPILIVLLVAVAGTLVYLYVPAVHATGWLETNRETFVLLCIGVLLAITLHLRLAEAAAAGAAAGRAAAGGRGRLGDRAADDARRLWGWCCATPASGATIGGLMLAVIPEGNVLLAVVAFGLGMAVFTILTGNAFAAFPVMATAIGVPVLIQGYGGDAAVVGAIGMLAGFCGTLMTPMAANFNIVPVRLLELDDQNAVVKAQIPTALPLLVDQHPADLFPGVLVSTDAPPALAIAPENRQPLRRDRARPCHQGISAQARSCAGRAGGRAGAARASSDLLRQLRLAQLRPRLLAAADDAAAVPGHARRAARQGAARRDADRGEGGGRARLSRPRLYRRLRAALWLGLAARAPRRGAAA